MRAQMEMLKELITGVQELAGNVKVTKLTEEDNIETYLTMLERLTTKAEGVGC